MEFPLTVVKGKEKGKVVHAPDLKGWLDAGWKVEGNAETKEPEVKPKKEKDDLGLDL